MPKAGENALKRALRERALCAGSWLQTPSPALAEILARSGFSWLAADCEHGELDLLDFANIARAVAPYPCSPLVRVKRNDVLEIRRALDLGAQGVIVPLVDSAAQARKAVAAAKFPPEGVRGFAFQRANEWGLGFDAYAKRFNDEVCVVVMIESKAAVEGIEEILAVEGVDGVFLGPYDLSGSYGVTGQTSHPLLAEACAKVASACAKAGKSAGLHIVKPEAERIEKALADGFTFLALGMDTVFIADGAATALGTLKGLSSK